MRIIRARDMRSFGRRGMDARVAVRVIGALFLRTVERAERIYSAMLSRGFRGDIPSMQRFKVRFADMAFMLVTVIGLVVFRFYSFPELIGRFLQETAR
jgi:cobalt/nickel transport system permease protein